MKKLLMILPMALILCFMVGCQDKEAMAELEEMKAQAEVEEQNKEIVNRMWEVWGKGDFEAFKELLAPDYAYYLPSGSTKPRSREEVIEIGKMLHNAFPDITFSIEELIAEGDRVIVRFIVTGTHEGEFQGIPATGNKYEHSGISISRIENGKVVEQRKEIDELGLMQQLGMELKPKETEK
ncbi:MAG: ester cyclase [Candidatus Aminicenantes bacterium]|nr:MAG: ester cyclase [Candidatus Aminicenantes bacterium]